VTDDGHYMGLCLDESRRLFASGLLPTAAIIVRGDEIIGRGHNRAGSHGTKPLEFDPTAHAEVTAIRDACRNLRALDLSGATIYVSMEPCPMCLWSIVHSKIDRLVLGGRHALVGRPDLGGYSVETLLAITGRKHLKFVTGILESECVALRREFERRREVPVWNCRGGEKYA
jgi:tRNA(adenine34) deaminase